ncbi:NADP-dependent oxidoreductase [Sulfitobacter sp. M57]|uniref:NADP-dependent oxidoreductase n=1 Tax=unclassified Sulfitobacter TaxID=196795 RepID=UPI0023E14251|nr:MULTISPECIES: NADP-dependent oxidoreductase [unclassified Sulfitobacter]MDF3413060.1 NADP-dependent oxidoreductase [Sulfitobacter sp. KE5]MDF3421656.1 NADP-dependent oxidoreductase [Sulfitobacter sp. KE43]MDF3431609.1 NADP-dependent oxidoreductase [Sulfitobacter sp. KE42]MDF3457250.1 NADP-dependent oxidoreductase [Sulfitobacter sp. S74]MDF3461153.1 NADP-dependent oxidoreductase [Sulfitobacter sp. Ks18]
MSNQMQEIVLASRPDGAPTPENFRLETSDMPTPGEGEVLVEVQYMSLDPYMRGRMDDAKSYAAPVPIGGKMEGGSAGKVIASNSPRLKEGDLVFGPFGWASHAVADAKMCRKLDPEQAPITTSLGVLGMPGLTGWHGLMAYGKPKAGETLVVAAATGPVGSIVGQMAKSLGLRVVGIAGGADKCKTAVDHFGFDACLDHRAYDDAKSLRDALKAECPKGVDIYFENVGGKVLEAVIPLMNPFGRIPICGMIAWYNAGGLGENAGGEGLTAPKLWRTILVNFLSVNGFIISNHWDRFPEFIREVAPKVASGEIAVQEDITEGLENAPQAFINLLTGGNTGKAIVKIA